MQSSATILRACEDTDGMRESGWEHQKLQLDESIYALTPEQEK